MLTSGFFDRWNLRIQMECDRSIYLAESRRTSLSPQNSDIEPASRSQDGPFGIDGFCWQGNEHHRIRNLVHKLIVYLWGVPDKTADFADLAVPVWGDHVARPDFRTVGSVRRDANQFFESNQIPFKVKISGRRVTLAEV